MKKKSAGILLYRMKGGTPEFFLVHPGGPFFKNKDEGFWSIPKGEYDDEQALDAAVREFEEETGVRLKGPFTALRPIKQKSGKEVLAWASEGDLDEKELRCNVFQLEWPPKSGKIVNFPEVDRGAWFSPEVAKIKVLAAQIPLIEELRHRLTADE